MKNKINTADDLRGISNETLKEILSVDSCWINASEPRMGSTKFMTQLLFDKDGNYCKQMKYDDIDKTIRLTLTVTLSEKRGNEMVDLGREDCQKNSYSPR